MIYEEKSRMMLVGGSITLATLLIVGEVALRECLGMCDAPLYEASEEWVRRYFDLIAISVLPWHLAV